MSGSTTATLIGVLALVNDTPDYQALSHDLGYLMIAHGAVMVIAGLVFGYADCRARLFPVRATVALMLGVILVALTQNSPEAVQLLAAALRDLGFAGMGAAVVMRGRESQAVRTCRNRVASLPAAYSG